MEVSRSLVIVAYDIGSDQRRMDVSALLAGLGARVQFSVFELDIAAEEVQDLAARLGGLIDPQQDQIRIWVVPGPAAQATVVLGNRRLEERSDFFLV